MLVDDINRAVEESANRLLQSSSPSVRFWTLKDILGHDREDTIVQRVLEECEKYPPGSNSSGRSARTAHGPSQSRPRRGTPRIPTSMGMSST